jgi:hypothetical protein
MKTKYLFYIILILILIYFNYLLYLEYITHPYYEYFFNNITKKEQGVPFVKNKWGLLFVMEITIFSLIIIFSIIGLLINNWDKKININFNIFKNKHYE